MKASTLRLSSQERALLAMEMTAAHWHQLQRAADSLAFADLRFEGGPWLRVMDWLEEMGLVDLVQGEQGYAVAWTVTPAGAQLLAEPGVPETKQLVVEDNDDIESRESGRETGFAAP